MSSGYVYCPPGYKPAIYGRAYWMGGTSADSAIGPRDSLVRMCRNCCVLDAQYCCVSTQSYAEIVGQPTATTDHTTFVDAFVTAFDALPWSHVNYLGLVSGTVQYKAISGKVGTVTVDDNGWGGGLAGASADVYLVLTANKWGWNVSAWLMAAGAAAPTLGSTPALVSFIVGSGWPTATSSTCCGIAGTYESLAAPYDNPTFGIDWSSVFAGVGTTAWCVLVRNNKCKKNLPRDATAIGISFGCWPVDTDECPDPSGACDCDYGVSPDTMRFSAAGGTDTITVTAGTGCAWTARSGASWCTLSVSSGTGNGTITVTVAANTTGTPRQTIVTVAGKLVYVYQDGAGSTCTYTVSPLTFSLDERGHPTQSVTVTTQPGCPWAGTTDVSWITLTTASGTGTGNLLFDVDANPANAQRIGHIFVAGYTVTVTQDPCCLTGLSISPGGHLNSSAHTVTVTITAGTGCPWVAAVSVGGLSATSGTGSGTIMWSVPANTSGAVVVGTVTVSRAGDPDCYRVSGFKQDSSPAGCTSCPTDCAACAGSYTLSVSGITDNPGMSGCVGYNGTFTLTRSGCIWSDGGGNWSLDCVVSPSSPDATCPAGQIKWRLMNASAGPQAAFYACSTGCCPPTSGWASDVSDCDCSAATMVLT